MDVSSTGNQEKPHFPLLRLPPEVRNMIYHHALDNAFPSAILPKCIQKTHPLHSAAASFTNLQLTSREVYREASEVLYREGQFVFLVSVVYAALLHFVVPLEPRFPNCRSYWRIVGRLRTQNIELRPDWYRWTWLVGGTDIWVDRDWESAMQIVSNELTAHFPSLRRLTLDFRYPAPNQSFRPTSKQWSPVSSIFERLQVERPHIRIEVLTWQLVLPGTEPPQEYQQVRMRLAEYTEMLSKNTIAEEGA